QENANLLCQLGAKGPGSKLHLHGKTGASTSTCKQKAKNILPSSSNHSSNGLTHQKHTIKPTEVAGRMQKWRIQLGEFDIHYRPRISVKGRKKNRSLHSGPCSRTGHLVLTDVEQE
ncbi:hypothetical protein Tco_0405951, partial [Tanacetum coccineum]